jgi:hypothetical protein
LFSLEWSIADIDEYYIARDDLFVYFHLDFDRLKHTRAGLTSGSRQKVEHGGSSTSQREKHGGSSTS